MPRGVISVLRKQNQQDTYVHARVHAGMSGWGWWEEGDRAILKKWTHTVTEVVESNGCSLPPAELLFLREITLFLKAFN